ncbi:MAG: VOC family protein [Candidatus Handelsmanbacteria bacterium]|nr:VOC family protein [Candidatus Handelsmanbacteria bacterium]
MSDLKVEHLALNVAQPVAMAEWYCRNLGMSVHRKGDGPVHMHFLADTTGRVLLELYTNPPELVPDYQAMNPLVLHLAFATPDIRAAHQRLVAAGAAPVGEISANPAGDQLAFLRDPWGLTVQLIQRVTPMP